MSATGLADSDAAADAKDLCRSFVNLETRACCLSTCIVSLARLRFLRGDQDPGVSLLVYFLVWVAPLDLSARSTPGMTFPPCAFIWRSCTRLCLCGVTVRCARCLACRAQWGLALDSSLRQRTRAIRNGTGYG